MSETMVVEAEHVDGEVTQHDSLLDAAFSLFEDLPASDRRPKQYRPSVSAEAWATILAPFSAHVGVRRLITPEYVERLQGAGLSVPDGVVWVDRTVPGRDEHATKAARIAVQSVYNGCKRYLATRPSDEGWEVCVGAEGGEYGVIVCRVK